jgi:hypothetical protein
MATVTGTFANASPRLSYEGMTVARGQYTANGVTVSVSDTILMVKVPNGATIIDGYISGTAGSGAIVFEIGVAGTDNNLAAALTLSATAQLGRFNNGGLPYKVSLSDDAVPQWSWVTATVASGSACTTASINLVVKYTAPGCI